MGYIRFVLAPCLSKNSPSSHSPFKKETYISQGPTSWRLSKIHSMPLLKFMTAPPSLTPYVCLMTLLPNHASFIGNFCIRFIWCPYNLLSVAFMSLIETKSIKVMNEGHKVSSPYHVFLKISFLISFAIPRFRCSVFEICSHWLLITFHGLTPWVGFTSFVVQPHSVPHIYQLMNPTFQLVLFWLTLYTSAACFSIHGLTNG